MSAIAGVFFFDRRPVSSALGQWLRETLLSHGPDKQADVTGPGLVMAHGALTVTPEDVLDRQPLKATSGHVLTWDGRLDNRDDLLAYLAGTARSDSSDAEIALRAYERWNEDALSRLVGDWSLAIWDARYDTMLLASDFMGVRPLYYFETREYVAWSTSLATLVQLSGRYDELDLSYIAGFAGLQPPIGLTPYKDIVAVPSGAIVRIARPGTKSVTRHWSLETSHVEYGTPRQYIDHFLHVFRDAVRSRLRASGTIWAELSGGIDSSAIVCMASHLIACGNAAATELHTSSHVHADVPDSPERPLMRAVEDAIDGICHYVESSDAIPDGALDWVMPDGLTPARLATHQMMAQMKARVLMAGDVGNVTTGDLADPVMSVYYFLARRRFSEARREAMEWGAATQVPPRKLWTRASANFGAVDACRRLLRRREPVGGGPTEEHHVTKNALVPQLAKRAVALYEETSRSIPRHIDKPKLAMAKLLHVHSAERRLVARERHHTVRVTYPFVDRRLVEFMMGVPTPLARRPLQTRALMMEALEGLLPKAVANQERSRHLPSPERRRYRGRALEALRQESLLVVERGFIDAAILKRRIDEVCRGRGYVGNLRRLEYLETWLRLRERQIPGVRDNSRVPSLDAYAGPALAGETIATER